MVTVSIQTSCVGCHNVNDYGSVALTPLVTQRSILIWPYHWFAIQSWLAVSLLILQKTCELEACYWWPLDRLFIILLVICQSLKSTWSMKGIARDTNLIKATDGCQWFSAALLLDVLVIIPRSDFFSIVWSDLKCNKWFNSSNISGCWDQKEIRCVNLCLL